MDRFFDAAGTASADAQDVQGGQNYLGAFVADNFAAGRRVRVTAGLRADSLRNFGGRLIDAVTGASPTVSTLAGTSHSLLSPSVNARWGLGDGWALRAGANRGFRAPTLAELYRRSSIEGLILKQNPELAPETIEGEEVGLDTPANRRFSAKLTAYTNTLRNPISHVVTAQDANGNDSQRTRFNLGRARSRGFELDGDWSMSHRWSATGHYLYTEALPPLQSTRSHARREASCARTRRGNGVPVSIGTPAHLTPKVATIAARVATSRRSRRHPPVVAAPAEIPHPLDEDTAESVAIPATSGPRPSGESIGLAAHVAAMRPGAPPVSSSSRSSCAVAGWTGSRVESSSASVRLDASGGGRTAGPLVPCRPVPGSQVWPGFPESARARNIEGTTRVAVSVGADGSVDAVSVGTSSGNADLDADAVDAVRQWRFEPARRGGDCVAIRVVVPVHFQLR